MKNKAKNEKKGYDIIENNLASFDNAKLSKRARKKIKTINTLKILFNVFLYFSFFILCLMWIVNDYNYFGIDSLKMIFYISNGITLLLTLVLGIIYIIRKKEL